MMSIMSPPKFLTAFDLPELKLPSGRRNITSVPTQALLMLNDPLVEQLAKHWAEAIIKQPHGSLDERIDSMVIAAWGRQANERERNQLESLLREVSTKDDLMIDQAAWTHLAHTLFNTKEFIHTR
jgi:hypothetical protein